MVPINTFPQTRVLYHGSSFLFKGLTLGKEEKIVNFTYEAPPAGKKYIFVTHITRNGHTIYASQYGLKAFRILVDA